MQNPPATFEGLSSLRTTWVNYNMRSPTWNSESNGHWFPPCPAAVRVGVLGIGWHLLPSSGHNIL